MAKRQIELSPEAREDLSSIWDYSISTRSLPKAEEYYNLLADRMDALAAGHLIGLPVLAYPGLLKSFVGSHVIYFRPLPSALRIVRVLHQSMDTEDKFDPT